MRPGRGARKALIGSENVFQEVAQLSGKARTLSVPTALHSAAAGGHVDVCELLLNHGASVNTTEMEVVGVLLQVDAS